jgi:hypothetical protein
MYAMNCTLMKPKVRAFSKTENERAVFPLACDEDYFVRRIQQAAFSLPAAGRGSDDRVSRDLTSTHYACRRGDSTQMRNLPT